MKLIRYKPRSASGENWDNAREIWEDNMNQLQRIDTQSQMAGELLGRYIQEPFADGYAYYQITGVLKDKVRIEVCYQLGDDWEIPYWGKEALIDKSYAEGSIAWRDSVARMMSERQEERHTKAVLDDIVAKQMAQ